MMLGHMQEQDVAEARPGDVAFELAWQDRDGHLEGTLEATNLTGRAIRLSGKPALVPLGEDGEPIGAETVVTLEFRSPGYVDLAPGERARTAVSWGGWDGPPAGGRVRIRWHGGEAEAAVTGPRQPTSRGPATNLTSSWFTRVE